MIQILFSLILGACIESIPNDTAMNRLYYYDHFDFCPVKKYIPPELKNEAWEKEMMMREYWKIRTDEEAGIKRKENIIRIDYRLIYIMHLIG